MLFQISIEELNHFAIQFWHKIKDGTVFAFHGDMGAGKTTVITALCRQKGVTGPITSPTFSIINEYTYSENGMERLIYHIDLYRLNSFEEVVQAGVEDCMGRGDICMIEWPEKAPGLFDKSTVHVYIQPVSDKERQIKITMPE
jgi:tRNA threonylcarbamoyladenosine biosynthesis protein TsaE